MPKALHIAIAIATIAAVAPQPATSHTKPPLPPSQCTVADPPSRTTVEIQMAYAADFCELISQALAGDVFHTTLLVTPGRTWHYPNTRITCRLHSPGGRSQITVRNSPDTCNWLRQHATDWHEKGHAAGPARQASFRNTGPADWAWE